ncbi:protein THEMIS2 isoform X2 [Sphaeramia orbicularis]|uniref:protein THEMIS2 isoform X2 n=1 Tax=Sphaeramia orbicularis TaxID=375764 RepID=UPI001181491C|nr:protein THEMIS2 isoform X2 [Sphaeramia orbicularis]
MADTTALPLQQLIASLDETCLPKILQVCSGVYFQGSIYELSGSEVCFSTGDLVKVIGLELQSVCCEDISNNEKFDLPINHTGLFKVVPEELPYNTVEEMLKLRPVGLESCLPFTFSSRTKMTFGNFTLGSGRALTVLSTEQPEGKEGHVRCHIQGQQEASAEVCIPFSTRGEFYERESEECFTLQEIMSSSCLRSRKFRFINKTKSEKPLILTPVYQVHAIMSLRKNILRFPSSLEVDVIDVTNLCKDVDFITPFSLTEVLSQPDESFPAVVEILESPESRSMFKCSWLPDLIKDTHLVFHRKGTSALVLISSLKSRKVQQYFLVSEQYGGKFRRRPREFNSVYEMYVASINVPGLKVSVTRNCEEIEEEGLPALSVGEQLEVIRCERMELPCGSNDKEKQTVEALFCYRIPEADEEDDDEDDKKEAVQESKEEIYLPLYMQAHFVEVLADSKKKYRLKELGTKFSLPLDVKVMTRDAELENDPLVGFPCLRIEGAMVEPTIQASFTNSPDQCFEIPTQWLNMSVSFTKEPLPWLAGQPPKRRVDSVTEVTDIFFYEFRKQGNSDDAPPPRPPKRNLSSSTAPKKSKSSKKSSSKPEKSKHRLDKSIPTKELGELTLNSKRRPPAPPPPTTSEDQLPPIIPRKHATTDGKSHKALPNTYVRMEDSKKKGSFCDATADVDSDHDYEDMNDELAEMVRKAQENVAFY